MQVGLHLSSSFGAAFIASVMSNPVDVAKTRLMNQRPVEGEPLPLNTRNNIGLETSYYLLFISYYSLCIYLY